jgi:transcription elongation GreA/GreB family factor
MSSEPLFQPPQRASDPHEFPTTSQGWHDYRRWLARHGRALREQLESASTLPEREAARREWEALGDLTARAETAFQQFQTQREDVEYAEYVRRLAGRIHSQWVSADSDRPSRDPRRQALTSLVFAEGEEGPGAGRPVGLDERGRALSASTYKLDVPEGEQVMRLPRANVLALTAVLEEFTARLMLARQTGELAEGDDYIQALVEMQADLESRRFGE